MSILMFVLSSVHAYNMTMPVL
uniref:Uncharacterized protein n=1 Tax=Arundo donax TaxID=35708 RepID=A0A0A9HDT8_ARUDO